MKKFIKRTITFILATILVVQNTITVFAGTNGYTDDTIYIGRETTIFQNINEETSNVSITYSDRDGYEITIVLGIIKPENENGATEINNNYYNWIKEFEEQWNEHKEDNGRGDTEWEEYLEEIDDMGWYYFHDTTKASSSYGCYLAAKLIGFDNVVSKNIEAIKQTFPTTTAKKEGYNLLTYSTKRSLSNNNMDVVFNEGMTGVSIKLITYDMEPIFVPLEQSYFSMNELKEKVASSEDIILKSGSIIFKDTYVNNGSSFSTGSPIIFVQEEGYVNVINGEFSNINSPTYYGRKGLENKQQFTTANMIANKLPDSYNGETVAYWKVKKIHTYDEFYSEEGDETAQSEFDNGKGRTVGTSSDNTWYEQGYYPTGDNYSTSAKMINTYIEVVPLQDILTPQNPSVSVDGFSLKLETSAPTDMNGSQREDKKGQVTNKFKVEKITDEYSTEMVDEAQLQEYSEGMNRTLHPGKYRVFHQAYIDDEVSGIKYTDITVEEPIVASPTINISNDNKATYTMNDISTGGGEYRL